MSDQFFWYVTRSAALVTWLAAALSILVGLTTSSRLLGRRPTIPWLVDFHRMLGGISAVFLGVHMLSLVFDSFVRFDLADLFVPWSASVPGLSDSSIAWGVIAAWMLIAVELSSLVKDRLNQSVWHTIHLLSFGTLGFGTLHAIQTGSDITNPIVSGIGVSTLLAVVLAMIVRLRRRAEASAIRATETAIVVPGPAPQPVEHPPAPDHRYPPPEPAMPRPAGTGPPGPPQHRARPEPD